MTNSGPPTNVGQCQSQNIINAWPQFCAQPSDYNTNGISLQNDIIKAGVFSERGFVRLNCLSWAMCYIIGPFIRAKIWCILSTVQPRSMLTLHACVSRGPVHTDGLRTDGLRPCGRAPSIRVCWSINPTQNNCSLTFYDFPRGLEGVM